MLIDKLFKRKSKGRTFKNHEENSEFFVFLKRKRCKSEVDSLM